MLPWIVGTFLFLLAYLGGVIISIILIGTSRFEILLLLGFAIVEAAIGFYLWVCIVSLFQVNNSTASASSLYADLNTLFRVVQVKQFFWGSTFIQCTLIQNHLDPNQDCQSNVKIMSLGGPVACTKFGTLISKIGILAAIWSSDKKVWKYNTYFKTSMAWLTRMTELIFGYKKIFGSSHFLIFFLISWIKKKAGAKKVVNVKDQLFHAC